VLLIDFYGHGESDYLRDFRAHNAATYTKQVREVIEHLGWEKEKLCFAGISLGGAVIQRYFLEFPDNVGRVVLVAAAGRQEPWWRLSTILHFVFVSPSAKLLSLASNFHRIKSVLSLKPLCYFTAKISVVHNTPHYGVPPDIPEKMANIPLSIVSAGLDEFHGINVEDWKRYRTDGDHVKVLRFRWMTHMIICSVIDWLELYNEPQLWHERAKL